MNNDGIKNEKLLDLIIKTVLVIIIIILLLHNCYLIKKNENNRKNKPTGNVDIIEIKCDKDDSCVIDKDNDKTNDIDKQNDSNVNTKPEKKNENTGNIDTGKKNENTSNTNIDKKDENAVDTDTDKKDENAVDTDTDKKDENTGNTDKEEDNTEQGDNTQPVSGDDIEEEEELFVRDTSLKWEGQTSAKIFTNSMYQLDSVIAPESSNTYQFVVKNGTNYDLKYDLIFIEDNSYGINMKYKLKKNDTYLIDHYVSADELNTFNVLLGSKTNDTYYLEWKWISSSNDTEIGINTDSKYGLKIDIKAESVNE